MKDKEKQIEEMANIIQNACSKCNECEIFTTDKFKYIKNVECSNLKGTLDAYNAGYRKIDKNKEVVLSRGCVSDKWIDLLTEFDEMGFEPTTLPPNDMSVEEYTSFYKEKLLMCLTKASKETAENILLPLLRTLSINIDTLNELQRIILMFAKQFGVEIKE